MEFEVFLVRSTTLRRESSSVVNVAKVPISWTWVYNNVENESIGPRSEFVTLLTMIPSRVQDIAMARMASA
jgi:hypothetical protein